MTARRKNSGSGDGKPTRRAMQFDGSHGYEITGADVGRVPLAAQPRGARTIWDALADALNVQRYEAAALERLDEQRPIAGALC